MTTSLFAEVKKYVIEKAEGLATTTSVNFTGRGGGLKAHDRIIL